MLTGGALAAAPAMARQCPGCTGAADPEAGAIGVAELPKIAFAQPAPAPREVRAAPKISKEPATWFNILAGGEYWYRDREMGYRSLDHVRRVRPQVMHASILGPELLGALPSGGEVAGVTPMRPKGITTVREYLAWWKPLIDEAHSLGVKVQATFSMSLLYDTMARDRGWFKYYNQRWETDLLGPKPFPDPVELMQRDRQGRPLIGQSGFKPDEFAYVGCENNPHWRQLMKQLVKVGIEAGFDGFMVQFNYRYECVCPYCQQAFRRFLAANHTPRFLRDRMGITDLSTALLDTTRGRGPDLVPPGFQADDRPGPLEMDARQFTSESVKNCLDEVFLEYGRSLKPDLMISTWAHMRSFLVPGVDYTKEGINPFNERMLLQPERWGRGEDYIHYCIGGTKSRLAEHNCGDASLSAKYIYSMGRGKAFMMAKYDYDRPRLTLAEAWAHRSIGLALDRPGFSEALTPYYAFARRYRDLYYPSDPHTELGLLYPRRAMYVDDAQYLTPFDRFARALLEGHALFDVLIDQHLPQINLSRYRAVLLPATTYLSAAERGQLETYRSGGGALLVAGRNAAPAQKPPALATGVSLAPPDLERAELADFVRKTVPGKLSGCDAPWTVQMTVWRQAKPRRLVVHLVNYDRDEAAAGLENPRAAGPVQVRLNLPAGARVTGARFVTPEQPDPRPVTAQTADGQAVFQAPGFLVYGVAILDYAS
jgi:hypothetical protein